MAIPSVTTAKYSVSNAILVNKSQQFGQQVDNNLTAIGLAEGLVDGDEVGFLEGGYSTTIMIMHRLVQ